VRHLILLRHAKSSWDARGLEDIDRPLNARGERDAPIMAARLRDHGFHPQRIVCSTARRTRATAAAFVATLNVDASRVTYSEDLYLASVSTALGIIGATPSGVTDLMLVGHNPGCTELANSLGDTRIDNVPTCGCVVLGLPVDEWTQVSSLRGKTVWFDYPKRPH